jgi:hypothetical protein
VAENVERLTVDPAKSQQLVDAGRGAKRILDDPIFKGAVTRLEGSITETWKRGKSTSAREEAHARWKGLQAVLVDLRSLMEAGALEADLASKRAETPKRKGQ